MLFAFAPSKQEEGNSLFVKEHLETSISAGTSLKA